MCNIFPKNFIIRSLEKEHHIHNFLLDSEYFLGLFSGNFKIQDTISLKYSGETVDNFIKLLYTGELKDPQSLIKLADEYLFDDLKELCILKIRYGDFLE